MRKSSYRGNQKDLITKSDILNAVIGFFLILSLISTISLFSDSLINNGNNSSNSNNGSGNGEGSNTNLITFTIGSTTLQAESGMTWGEWVNSSYNPGDFGLNDDFICLGNNFEYAVFNSNGNAVLKNEVILRSQIYHTYFTPASNPVDYYLVGFINGADYGCAGDYATIGDYKFVNGKLVVTFDAEDNYVFVKTGDNAKWYRASAYSTDTTVTLVDSITGANEKLYVPGGVELTFTLVVNDDDTVILSYTVAAASDPDTGGDEEDDLSNLFVFSVGQTLFVAENGMTWNEWINSTYNSSSLHLRGDNVFADGESNYAVCNPNGNPVLKDEVILHDTIYHTSLINVSKPGDYYLVGFINGADYGCAGDYANLGDYKFVNGKLVVTFEADDNYVFVKTGDNTKWYMAPAYSTDTIVTLANSITGTSEKLYVPGGVEVTFTLVVNNDDTVTLSYTHASLSDPDIGGDGDSSNIIAFSIGDSILQAEKDMTWLDWLVTSYNTTNFIIERNYISYFDSEVRQIKFLFNPSGNVVSVFDTIIENAVYTFLDQSNVDLSSPGGGSNAKIYSSFKVGSGTLIAEEGMTWIEWLSDSRYNISGFVTDGDYVFASDRFELYLSDDHEMAISVREKVIHDGVYQFLMDPYFAPDVINPYLFTFTIGNHTFYAVNGMSWVQWIDSGYNPGPYELLDDNICFGTPDGGLLYTSGGNIVLKDDLIGDGDTYRFIIPDNSDPTPDPDIGGDGEGDSSNLITFTVVGYEFNAENGMTWGEWFESNYYSGNLTSSGDFIILGTVEYMVFTSSGKIVKIFDVIVDGESYRVIKFSYS